MIEKFHQLGFTGREAEVYFALLQKQELSAAAISKVTSVSRTKSYEILQNLVKKNICSEQTKNGIKVFSAIEPTIAIQNIISTYEAELKRKKDLAAGFVEYLVEVFKQKEKNNVPMDYIEILNDPGQIRQRWLNIIKHTQKELLAFTKPPYTKNLNDNLKNEASLIKRKVSVKGVYEYKDLDTDEEKKFFISVIANYQNIGEDARIVEELPMKLVISDRKTTMFALNDKTSLKSSITTMIVNHPDFALALIKVFESYWTSGIKLQVYKNTFCADMP